MKHSELTVKGSDVQVCRDGVCADFSIDDIGWTFLRAVLGSDPFGTNHIYAFREGEGIGMTVNANSKMLAAMRCAGLDGIALEAMRIEDAGSYLIFPAVRLVEKPEEKYKAVLVRGGTFSFLRCGKCLNDLQHVRELENIGVPPYCPVCRVPLDGWQYHEPVRAK